MATKKYTYRVKQGRVWGPYKQYGPGSTLELTADEAAGFPDTLELVKDGDGGSDNTPPDEAAHLSTLNIPQLRNLPEWDEVAPPKPTTKDDIIAAIMAVRHPDSGDDSPPPTDTGDE